MSAVRKKIASERIPCSEILVSGRPMLTALRARILRSEIDDISLSRALLIADAVGLDLSESIVAAKVPEPRIVEVIREVYIKPTQTPRHTRKRQEGFVGDLFAAAA